MQLNKILQPFITLFVLVALLAGSAQAIEVETGYNGTIKQLSDIKTPYNTVLMDTSGRVLLWSFEIGSNKNKLSIETTALNNIFSLPQILASQNKEKIVEAIKANPKFDRMMDYYREYLKSGNSSKQTYYFKLRDSIMLDLIEMNAVTKLF